MNEILSIIVGSVIGAIPWAIYLYISLNRHVDKLIEKHEKESESLFKERQQLLDRIQAPSFDHLKAAEVRVIKAQKEEPQERIELL